MIHAISARFAVSLARLIYIARARAREQHIHHRASDIYYKLWFAIAFTTTGCGNGFSTVFSLDGPTFWAPNGGHEQ
jgi:hypothetical protein